MKKILLLIGFIFLSFTSFSQKEALTWFFGKNVRLNFHTGAEFPQQAYPSSMFTRKGSFCLSDRNTGQPLFYSNGEIVWSASHQPMPNGAGLYGLAQNQQPGIAFEVPGNTHSYYIFTNGNHTHPGCFYSVVDMQLNGGLGDIATGKKNIRLSGIDSVQGAIMAIKHPNHKSYWVVFRSLERQNKLYSYLVDEDGVSSEPVVSECLTDHIKNDYSMSKFSPDGNFYCYTAYTWVPEQRRTYELYSFNDLSGQFTSLFLFSGLPDRPEYDMEHRSNGIEFSADSKFLYSSIQAMEKGTPPTPKQFIVQFDMKRTNSVFEFESSERLIHVKDILDKYCQMQLARDGRIYIANGDNKDSKSLSRIFFPFKRDTLCEFREAEIELGFDTQSTFGLPLFVPSYLNRFDWLGNCFPDSTYFKSHFLPLPAYITWSFGDGSPTKTGLNVVHKYQAPGTYTVTAVAQFGHEGIETVSREVTISRYPNFDLGPDFSVCPGEDTTLSAGIVLGADLEWSNGSTESFIDVPAGEYWLTAENRYGCVHSDSIEITEYLAPTIDNSNVEIFPATCTGPTGSITGVEIQGAEPYTYIWSDESGNTVANTLDVPAIGPGTYSLNVIDANGCPWGVPPSHTVTSVGTAFVLDVDPSPTYCSFPTGTINVIPDPRFSGDLEYQLDNGPWVSDSLFKDLVGKSYTVKIRVRANPTCINNDWGSVVVQDFPAPILTSVDPTYELDNNSNGTLTINVPGVNFYYVIIDSAGVSHMQYDNPLFENLPSGTYQCYAYDINNCASDTLIAIVPQIYSTLLTGDLDGAPPVCVGEHTFVDVKVHNFEGIVDFTATLDYDRSKMQCLPDFINLHPSLGTVNMDVNTATGRVILTWNSITPLTLTDTVIILRLEFATLNPGTAAVTWDLTQTEFIEGPGYHLLVSGVTPTQVIIYANPSLSLSSNPGTCNGTPITISPNISPPGSYSYLWLKPNGFTASDQEIYLSNPTTEDQGQYRLIITDANRCVDTARTNLSVFPLPGYAFSDSLLYFDFPDTLFAEAGYQTYLWNNGESTSGIIISDSGYYSVVVTDINGCFTESQVYANGKALKPFFYDLPNAFTPNNDGMNDVFRPATDYELITKFILNIYNRWGQLVFTTSDPLKGWDGTVNGYDAMKGPYAWTIIYSNYNTFNVSSKGIVWLIR